MGEWMDWWVDGSRGVKAVLRIAYSNIKSKLQFPKKDSILIYCTIKNMPHWIDNKLFLNRNLLNLSIIPIWKLYLFISRSQLILQGQFRLQYSWQRNIGKLFSCVIFNWAVTCYHWKTKFYFLIFDNFDVDIFSFDLLF